MYFTDRGIEELVERRGEEQVSLAWLADRPLVTAPILGNRTLEQLSGSLAIADTHLDPALTARLDAVSAPVMPDYPYGELGLDQRSRTLS